MACYIVLIHESRRALNNSMVATEETLRGASSVKFWWKFLATLNLFHENLCAKNYIALVISSMHTFLAVLLSSTNRATKLELGTSVISFLAMSSSGDDEMNPTIGIIPLLLYCSVVKT